MAARLVPVRHGDSDRQQPVVISSASQYTPGAAPSAEAITAQIREEEFEVHSPASSGIQSYYGIRVASNAPCEDDLTHAIMANPFGLGKGKDWNAWGIFDGHVSWEMSAQLRETLLPAVWHKLQTASALRSAMSKDGDGVASDADIEMAIKNAFLSLDKALIDDAAAAVQSDAPISEVIARIKVASAGSCALLSLYDPATQLLRVACVGDSRAVLGRKVSVADEWKAIPLSIDQTGSNKDEAARIESEHPGENGIIKGGPGGSRVLGIMVSRAFGDGFWKWDAKIQKKIARTYFNGAYAKMIPFEGLKTPPYLIALPVVTTTKIEPNNHDFVIMASDGFWEHVSNDQAVTLVRKWVEWKDAGMPEEKTDALREGEPVKVHRIDEERFEWHEGILTLKDANVATHLVRNALGGADEQFLQAVFTFDPPRSRNVRDDVTVQVIFFGKAK